MRSLLSAVFLFLLTVCAHAQDKGLRVNPNPQGNFGNPNQNQNQDPNAPGQQGQDNIQRAPIDLYKIVSYRRDTTHLDTTQSIQKEYKFNYLRRDRFELLPFSNVGLTHNSLAYRFDRMNMKPLFVAQSHHFNYMELEDMSYFNVPTPLTELYYKTAFEQGQQLDAFFTVNTSEHFNFSVAYKGLRSLGKYQHSLASTGNFRVTTNYTSPNDRFRFRGHMTAQDILNQENGGLTNASLLLFRTDDPEFTDRGRLDVKFEDAENVLKGNRFYGELEYDVVRSIDSTSRNIVTAGGAVMIQDKSFSYRQTNPFDEFGPSYVSSNLRKRTDLSDFQATGYARFENRTLGVLQGHVRYTDYNYGYNSVLELDDGRIENRILGSLVEVGAAYKKQIGEFGLEAEGAVNVAGDLDANYLQGELSYRLNDAHDVKARARIHSVAPNFNFLLYQSDYVNYNWQTNFENVKTQELAFELESERWLDLEVSYTGIDDYAYFAVAANDSTPTPMQYSERVDYLRVKAEREFRWRKFALMNTVMYQSALSGEEVFKVPELITRQSLYYQDRWFKNALFVQTGLNFTYFTSYNLNAYDPVLAEFYVQDQEELGAFPMVDLFFNVKVRGIRIFFKWEHLNQVFTSTNTHFSAPGYPYRDAIIRFGVVWNFLL
jgi:hypothetical protein